MISYFISKFIYYLSIFVGIILFSFILFHIIPIDPARIVLGPNASQTQVEQFREDMGMNKPLYFQLAQYVRNVATLNFGHSYVDNRNVLNEVAHRLKITLTLLACSLLLIILYLLITTLSFRFPFLKKGTDLLDFVMTSLPVFFSGIIVALLTLYFYPITTFSGNLSSLNDILYLIPPGFVLALYPMAILSSIFKDEMSKVLQSPYITAEKALGFSEIFILFRYALKNILTPVFSALSNILPVLFTGAFIVEIIFSIPGIGSILIKSILARDFPMLECTVIVNGAFFVVVNLCFETLYPIIDPRIAKKTIYEPA